MSAEAKDERTVDGEKESTGAPYLVQCGHHRHEAEGCAPKKEERGMEGGQM